MLYFYTFLLLLFAAFSLQAQPTQYYAPNGGIFTPKGDLRVLLVFVTFKDHASSNPNFQNLTQDQNQKGWAIRPNSQFRLPESIDTITGDCREFMFSAPQDFEKLIDSVKYNYSKEYYLMSKGKFRLTGEVFRDSLNRPMHVEIDPEGCGWWSQCNRKAWEEMQKLNPNMDWARFDQRKNSPYFNFDNSDTAQYPPDKILDYVVFIYRYQISWPNPPIWGMHTWAGAGGGVATTGLGVDKNAQGYSCREGFTMCHNSGVFIHEIAHTLYNMPHIFGTNKVLGDYFYLPSVGWGATSMIAIFRGGLTAWERWYLGYIDWVADINNNQNEEQVFELRDYVMTGDAARIALPHSPDQYLYIEHHRGKHVFDRHIWQGNGLGNDTVGRTEGGLYMYVAALPDKRTQPLNTLSEKANSVRLLNANGNFDYTLADTVGRKNAWNNDLYTFKRGAANPISGLNAYIFMPLDKNKDGQLNMDKNYNQGKFEGVMLMCEQLEDSSILTHNGGLGAWTAAELPHNRKPSFQAGDKLNMWSNPMIINHPKYDPKAQTLAPYILNGLALEVQKGSSDSTLRVVVKHKQTDLLRATRYAGHVILPNISGDSLADLRVCKSCILTIAKTKTPNRHTAGDNNDFTNPTLFVVDSGATLALAPRAILRLEAGSTLQIAQGGRLILGRKAKIICPASATIDNKGELIRYKRAK
jgi:M6 family metalloprotease-like protein